MALLQDFVNSDESFECLDFVGKNGLAAWRYGVVISTSYFKSRASQVNLHLHGCPEGLRGPVIPRIDDACSHMFALGGDFIGVGSLLDANGKLLIGSGWCGRQR